MRILCLYPRQPMAVLPTGLHHKQHLTMGMAEGGSRITCYIGSVPKRCRGL